MKIGRSDSNRSAASGFTLIEILISLTILVIGLVGILALFPVGIHASRASVEETSASILAESVHSSLIFSLDLATPGQPIEYFHDGVSTGLTFTLPEAGGGASVELPQQAAGGPPAGEAVFHVGRPHDGAHMHNFRVLDEEDREHYGQYAFNFTVRPSANPARDGVFEIVLRVFRNHRAGAKPILTYLFLVAGDR